ncbi:MAG: hypothetical protein HZB70_01000 [Candidatus Berkelbacteria bacterium]|nr:MAG: hypothetical protein HZB70_01000 [Candidatus Berkelbacteria bacterium]QQG52083.1 MAG: hypothetical protein HY845_01995 [Candidatus Berkelbacteria bacterium]
MDPNSDEYKNFLAFKEDRLGTAKLRDEVVDKFVGHITDNLKQRRELLKHITIISAGIVAVLPVIQNGSDNSNLFFWGIFLLLVTVVLTVSYLREKMDLEGQSLQDNSEKYLTILKTKLALLDRYIGERKFSNNNVSEYLDELENEPTIRELGREVGKPAEKERLEYFSEFVVFLFVSALFLLASALVPLSLNPYEFFSTIVVIFIVSFTGFASLLSRVITDIIDYFLHRIR